MRVLHVVVCLLLAVSTVFGQAASGTITGTVVDPAGAVVAGANVEARNSQTGVVYPAVSTNTGNFTLSQLPPGTYELTVTVSGFKKYVHTNLTVAAAEILRQDATLEVGAASEAVTVTAEASQLRTESGDIAQHITLEQLNDLPVLGIGGANSGSSGVRNPFNSLAAIPGLNYAPNFVMIVNGAPSNSGGYRLEGLDNTNHTVNYALQENQPSADAIQEVAIQTSNYAPEFGQAGGGLFNITMKSGSNGYHGTVYEYFVNEDLNAAFPFTNDGSGHKVRPRNRRNDYGGTLGGPIVIPKIYNGHDKTFFFFSYEEYREGNGYFPNLTVPTLAYRQGDFSAISPNGGANFNLNFGVPAGALPSTDALGRQIFANTIYDPASRKFAPNGVAYADPFPNNVIPAARFDPTAVKIQALIPQPSNSNFINNGVGNNLLQRVTPIPSLKIDQAVGSKGHASFYWSTTGTDAQFSVPNGNADGLPDIITGARGTFIHSLTLRVNYDYTLTPTLLLHLGAGYSRIRFLDSGPVQNFNCAQIGLQGCQANIYFPNVPTMVEPGAGAVLGGMQLMGNALAHTLTNTERPAYNANLTWVKGSHTYKAGGEVWFQGNITAPPSGTQLIFDSCTVTAACTPTSAAIANAGATALPQVGLNLSGWNTGFPYANFLLGDVTSITQKAPTDLRMGKAQWALFLQDSWKATRKLTLDYGVRWDYATAPREQYGRSATLGPVPNPAAGGRIGAPIFEATCHCVFVSNYPWGIGPRVGAAYQITPRTVLRGGWGFVYSFAPDITANSANQIDSAPAGPNAYFNLQTPGVLPQPVWPNFDPGQTPLPGQTTGFNGFTSLDRNIARPPRQVQWSIGIQRELSRNLVIEASYVGNRGVWWSQNGPLGRLNQVSPEAFAAYGLHPYTDPNDNLLLGQQISSAPVISRVGVLTPYAGYPTTSTLINALRPYPQFSTINVTGSPTGKTWYDSLQVRANKRLSHGLQATATFTWSKAMVLTREDIFNPASSSKSIQSTDQPFLFNTGITYTTPAAEFLNNRALKWLTKDWLTSAILVYGSGLPLTPPVATTVNNLAGSQMFRVAGQPLYLKDLNCGCINPYFDQVLNPKAWVNPVNGGFGPGPIQTTIGALTLSALYYSDFRQARRPQENLNIGRNFRIREKMSLQIRAEFVNIFNRTQTGNPVTANPQAPPTKNQVGYYTGGFGVINDVVAVGATPSITQNAVVGQLYQQPRQGTLIARFTF
ncbi:MAG: hypothetical protein C5B51_20485 [Terriglobia bacterium]|nr:MAG: hypothetical protein C5B51_20485 [Terriglobia bacterium]